MAIRLSSQLSVHPIGSRKEGKHQREIAVARNRNPLREMPRVWALFLMADS
jgi:hypothetical protein